MESAKAVIGLQTEVGQIVPRSADTSPIEPARAGRSALFCGNQRHVANASESTSAGAESSVYGSNLNSIHSAPPIAADFSRDLSWIGPRVPHGPVVIFFRTILAGLPITMDPAGTFCKTTLFGDTMQLFPI